MLGKSGLHLCIDAINIRQGGAVTKCSFDARTVDGLLRGQEQGRNNGERLFALILFELWRRE
jgi:hypothetical protein